MMSAMMFPPEVPGARVQVGFGGAGEKLMLALTSDDGEALVRAARDVERELRTIPGIGNVASSSSLTRPELTIRPDAARASDLGVTTAAIADTMRIATAGDFDQDGVHRGFLDSVTASYRGAAAGAIAWRAWEGRGAWRRAGCCFGSG